jgi:hypothetical protein
MRGWSIAFFSIMLASSAAADDVPARDRQAVLAAGRGSWTVDDGGTLTPIEVSMLRAADGWQFSVHGMYPIMGVDGKISEPASRIQFWLADEINGKFNYLQDLTQNHEGHWEPGDGFQATFKIPGKIFEEHPHLGVHLCVGSYQRCWPSNNLEPRH